jgi:hypothetical protein
MARYDDDINRMRRRDDDDPDDYAQRPDDDPPRRDTLMQRRLRRARGEELDDEYYEDDDLPPRYSRPRSSHTPYSTGGGCANAVLYIVIGAIAVLIIVLLAGNQLLSRFTGGLPQQVQRIVASPTPTIRDRGGTIQQIRALNRLETQSFAVERVIDARIERGNPLDVLLGDRLLLIASGDVIAGVDLSKLTPNDVRISEDGESITLNLPPSQIFQATLDNERTRVYDRQQGIFAPENKDLETQARQQAEAEILKAACEGNIMQKAADEAKRSMEQFLKVLDFKSVTVNVSAGPCAASPTVPTLPTTTP